ncbi:hypothetical protein [uncultured Phascolarctobacterium sp.]|jgi:hypothetical protein|uniref:hypothetical protein n=1 Tax=uncultured Phascolarctobacterium sp. TaxID=512296 RepID=UPI0027D94966|nr:hypothetical protein [uncultured Phascolarctobacterium sp.]
MKKTLIIIFLIILSVSAFLVSKQNSKLDYSKMSPKERVIYIHNNFYIPLKKNHADFITEYEGYIKTTNTLKEFHKMTLPLIKDKYEPYITTLQKNMPDIEDKAIQEIYDYAGVLEFHLFPTMQDLLFDLEKRAEIQRKLDEKTSDFDLEIYYLDKEVFEKCDYEYQNEYSKIINGKGTYQLNLDNYNKIEKGMPIIDVVRIFKMPATFYDFSPDSESDERYYFFVLEENNSENRDISDEKDLTSRDKYVKITTTKLEETFETVVVKKETFGVR